MLANDIGVILVGHGSSLHDAARQTIADHAAALGAQGVFGQVRYATLNGGPDPKDELGRLSDMARVLVLPMFMSDGFLVRTALPARLGAASSSYRVNICQSIGLEPALVRLCARVADSLRADHGWQPNAWDILIAAHGSSKDPASRRATQGVAADIKNETTAHGVMTAYIEEPPYIGDVVTNLVRPTVVVGLFAAAGGHATEDLPEALKHAQQPVASTGAIGCNQEMADVAMDALVNAMSRWAVAV